MLYVSTHKLKDKLIERDHEEVDNSFSFLKVFLIIYKRTVSCKGVSLKKLLFMPPKQNLYIY